MDLSCLSSADPKEHWEALQIEQAPVLCKSARKNRQGFLSAVSHLDSFIGTRLGIESFSFRLTSASASLLDVLVRCLSLPVRMKTDNLQCCSARTFAEVLNTKAKGGNCTPAAERPFCPCWLSSAPLSPRPGWSQLHADSECDPAANLVTQQNSHPCTFADAGLITNEGQRRAGMRHAEYLFKSQATAEWPMKKELMPSEA